MSGAKIPDARPGFHVKNGPAGGTGGESRSRQTVKTDTSNIPGKEGGRIPSNALKMGAAKPANAASSGQKARSLPVKAVSDNQQKIQPLPNPANGPFRGQSADKTYSARDIFMQTASAMGFPKDALSMALLAFARFFSLSLDSALMGALRREILASGRQSSPGAGEEKAEMEADAAAACAARDKGVVLGEEALRLFARLHSLPVFGNGGFPSRGRSGNKESESEDGPDAGELKKIAEDQNPKEGFTGFMNALPGKNGQYWLVYPFIINMGGTEFNVILRLLKRGPSSYGGDEYIIADIAGPKRTWRCILTGNAGRSPKETALFQKGKPNSRAEIRVYPALSAGALKHLSEEASRILGKRDAAHGKGHELSAFGGFDEILVRNGNEEPSWMEDLCDECMPSIDEEV